MSLRTDKGPSPGAPAIDAASFEYTPQSAIYTGAADMRLVRSLNHQVLYAFCQGQVDIF